MTEFTDFWLLSFYSASNWFSFSAKVKSRSSEPQGEQDEYEDHEEYEELEEDRANKNNV